jgi:membrane protease YdiL (CAAX protease family)
MGNGLPFDGTRYLHNRGAPIDSVAAATGQQVTAKPRTPVAGPLHTLVFLLILFGSASLMYVSAGRMRAVEQPSRVLFYVTTIVWEWLLMAYILVGVRLHHTPLLEVMGARWTRAKDVFRDIGIALAFWIVALIVLGLVAHLLHFQGMKQNVRFLAPEGRTEIVLWIAVSLTAGICEETIFRGYLQKQFIAWTGSVPAGVLLSAVVFGVGHIYQGAKATVVIGVYGLMFGMLAQRRRSMRPGMMTHALHDTVSGLAIKFLPK